MSVVSCEIDRHPAEQRRPGGRDLDARDTHQVEETAGNYALDGTGIRVGIWDEGRVRTTHVELEGRVEQVDAAMPLSLHATHMAGTIAACGATCPGDNGNAQATGIAPQARIVAYDWHDDIAELREAAAGRNGTPPIRCSVHAYGRDVGWYRDRSNVFRKWAWYRSTAAAGQPVEFGRYDARSRAIDAVAYDYPGLSMFKAAGNYRGKGPDGLAARPRNGVLGGYDTLEGMAVAKNPIVIGAIEDILEDPPPASAIRPMPVSSFGPTDDGRIKPDLVANGAVLLAPSSASDFRYQPLPGTSMATAVAGGICALLSQLAERQPGLELTSAMLKAVLVHTAQSPEPGPNLGIGWGSIRADRAARAIAGTGGHRLLAGRFDRARRIWTWTGEAPAYAKVRATLAWTDPPGSAAGDAAPADDPGPKLVNDLDLRLIDPAGGTHYPWRVRFDRHAQPAEAEAALRDGPNHADNVERVDVRDGVGAAGPWTVVVEIRAAPVDGHGQPAGQDFALVVEGLDGDSSTATGEPAQGSAPRSAGQGARPRERGEGWSHKYALLIGIDDYRGVPGARVLAGPKNDLDLMQRVLIDRLGFAPADIRRLYNEDATHCGIRAALAELGTRAGPGDLIYIHYSGHGSRFVGPAAGVDERDRADETWVAFGARGGSVAGADCAPGDPPSLNRFDILDDEINGWLAALDATGARVVLVSDSCHSGTVTRDAVPGLRTMPPIGEHPLADPGYRPRALPGVIRIAAADDRDHAMEDYFNERDYGLFTWYWASALEKAERDDTWRDVFARAAMRVRKQCSAVRCQRPQIDEGDAAGLTVLGGAWRAPRAGVGVAAVAPEGSGGPGEMVTLDAGALGGITAGSLFRDTIGAQDAAPLAEAEVVAVGTFDSEAVVRRGALSVGDRLVEAYHAFPPEPLRVLVAADAVAARDDTALARQLRDIVDDIPGVVRTDIPGRQDLELYLLHPARGAAGRLRTEPGSALPPPSAGVPAELWLLDRAEQPIPGQRHRIPATAQATRQLVRDVLTRYARARAMTRLEAPADGALHGLVLTATLREPVTGQEAPARCDALAASPGASRERKIRVGAAPAGARWQNRSVPLNSCLRFSIENNGLESVYAYLIDITPAMEIKTIFPLPRFQGQEARIDPDEVRELVYPEPYNEPVWFRTDTPGEDVLKLLVTRQPIDIELLDTRRARAGRERNALETLLARALDPHRGAPPRTASGDWVALQLHLLVTDRPPVGAAD